MAESVVEKRLGMLELTVSDMASLPGQVGEMQGQMGQLQAQVGQLQVHVGELRVDLAGLRQDVGGMRKDVDGLREDVVGLRRQMVEVRDDLSATRADLRQEITKARTESRVLFEEVLSRISLLHDAAPVSYTHLDGRQLQGPSTVQGRPWRPPRRRASLRWSARPGRRSAC